MKIWKVRVSSLAYVYADTEDDAMRVADRCMSDIIGDDVSPSIDVDPGEIVSLSQLKGGWDGGCIPYGVNGDRYLSDILEVSP